MKRTKRATIHGWWWTHYFNLIRRCFSCGGKLEKLFVRSEGRRRHVCRHCKRITYLNPKLVAGVIPVTKGGRLVLLRRDIDPGRGLWTYPAGFQEIGETCAEAAVRETFEEIQARVRLKGCIGVYSYPDAGVVTIVYVGEVFGKKPSAGIETQEVKLFHPREIPWKQLAFRSTVQGLKDWLKMARRNNFPYNFPWRA